MMIDLLNDLQFWHWWVLGIVFLAIEIFAPGAIFIWFSASAVILGFILVAMPEISWQIQITLFAVLSILLIVGWRQYRKNFPEKNEYPTLNKRGEELVGRVFTLDEPIVNNFGKIRVDDTMWKINGNDAEVGHKVKVTSLDGTVLNVERV